MKKYLNPLLLLLPAVLALLLAGCFTIETCDDDNQSYLQARFRTIDNGNIADTIMDGISIYGFRDGYQGDLLYDSISLAKVKLPLDPHGDVSKFVFSTAQHSDTLVIEHSSEVYLVSRECGFAIRFSLTGYAWGGELISGVEEQDNTVDAEYIVDEEHIWIYF